MHNAKKLIVGARFTLFHTAHRSNGAPPTLTEAASIGLKIVCIPSTALSRRSLARYCYWYGVRTRRGI